MTTSRSNLSSNSEIIKERRSVFGASFFALLVVPFLLTACASELPPLHPENICSIYKEKRDWYESAMHAQKHWGVSSCVPMAIMYQESGFRAKARTRRVYLLGFIPWGRVTSAYGYAQAVDGVWREYQSARGFGRSRSRFGDALDFIDWYMANAHKYGGVPKGDAYGQYIAYHDGIGAYKRSHGRTSASIRNASEQVARRAARYEAQYRRCAKSLRHRSLFDILFGWL